jgi:phosphoribosyl-ATP pyrophosphohydrolase
LRFLRNDRRQPIYSLSQEIHELLYHVFVLVYYELLDPSRMPETFWAILCL